MQTREVIRRLVREHPLLESLSEPERRFVEDIGVTIVHYIMGVAGRYLTMIASI